MFFLCAAMALAPPLLDPRATDSLIAGRAHQEHGFVPPALVADVRRSLVALGRSGILCPATSFSSDGQEDDLRSALTCKPDMDDDSMYALYERLDDLREQLQQMLGMPLSPGIEATYVVYPTGGYYKRHIDAVEGIDPQGSGRRCVSFICYLNAPGDWAVSDGGALRIYGEGEPQPPPSATGELSVDLPADLPADLSADLSADLPADLPALTRRELQELAKRMGVRANQKSVDMLAELEALLPRHGRDAGGGGGGGDGGGGGGDPQKCAPELFVHLLVNHPRQLRRFLQNIVDAATEENRQTSTTVGNTLLELLLLETEWGSGGEDGEAERERCVMGLLRSTSAIYDADHALVLVQMHGFKAGELYLYEEKLRRYDMVVQHHMETGNRRGVFDECRRRAAKDPQLWKQALRHLVSQPEGADVGADVEEVLRELEGAGQRTGGMAPLPVVQVLQSTPTVTLGSVRGFLTNWIAAEREAADEDREAMDELVEESDDVRARTAQMRARLGRLERADYRHEEDMEYDEYEQEESKRLLSVRKDLDRKAQDHEGFARDVSARARIAFPHARTLARAARSLPPIACAQPLPPARPPRHPRASRCTRQPADTSCALPSLLLAASLRSWPGRRTALM
jgi:hypothetical protein